MLITNKGTEVVRIGGPAGVSIAPGRTMEVYDLLYQSWVSHDPGASDVVRKNLAFPKSEAEAALMVGRQGPSRMELLVGGIERLDPQQASHWNRDGRPNVSALADAAGLSGVSDEERDEAHDRHQEMNAINETEEDPPEPIPVDNPPEGNTEGSTAGNGDV